VLRALSVELAKARRQRLLLAALVAVVLLSGLFAWGTWRHPLPSRLPGTAGGDFVVGGKVTTAPFLAYMVLRIPVGVGLLLPLLLATFTGGLIAGERHQGTLRTLLVRPVTRAALVAAKLLTAWLYAACLALFLGGSALLLGYAFFGPGDLVPLPESSHLVFFSHAEGLLRLAVGYGLAALVLMALASVGLFFSAVCDNPLTATGLTAAFLFLTTALAVIPYFESWKPYLLVTYLDLGAKVFVRPFPWPLLGAGLLHLLPYHLIPAILAGVIFNRRDVLN
jgi:ABC-type transport system involved in multi-copper enzyme maturation permease subunit